MALDCSSVRGGGLLEEEEGVDVVEAGGGALEGRDELEGRDDSDILNLKPPS
jgi:hypothetical protein